MTRLLTIALAGHEVRWWEVALAVIALAIVAVAVVFVGRRALPAIRGWSRRRQVLTAGATLAIIAGGAFAAYKALERPADVLNPDAAFHRKRQPKPAPKPKTVNWPVYGYDDARTRDLATWRVHPPFQPSSWSYQAGQLLEFSPIVVRNRIYVLDKAATLITLDAKTGRPVWTKDLGALSASSPAYSHGLVYAVTLSPGQVDAMSAEDGKIKWTRTLPGRTETSPIVHGGKVFVGCECGVAYALDAKSGKVRWSVSTGGAIKGGMALDHGTVFFGNYAGQLYAVDAASGKVKWQTETQGGSFLSGGGIYSTPAVAYGRVYVGSIDGRVYSYTESGGSLAWSHSTGAEVYPGPAVADPRGAPPTVYIGSADQNVYALDAKSGGLRWEHDVGGIVLGAASVVGSTVYFGVIGPNIGTLGFNAATGRKTFEHDLGEYNPVISDGQNLYLTGTSELRAFSPFTKEERRRRHQRREAEARKQRQRREAEARRHRRHRAHAHAKRRHHSHHKRKPARHRRHQGRK